MKYIERFKLPSFDQEALYLYPTKYPFGLFPQRDLSEINFANITIFYGGNGSGKSTLLNIINSKLGFERKSEFYADETFHEYVRKCKCELAQDDYGRIQVIPSNSKIIASEDIINFILKVRNKNKKTEERQKELAAEYDKSKYTPYQFNGMEDYDRLVKKVEAQRKTKTSFINSQTQLLRQFSNGESVLRYFDVELQNDGLYLLDEPENCLSPKLQIELLKLIMECARYCDCQFVIATHSPFLLSIPGAKIYNLDLERVTVCEWNELENVRLYYEFFMSHKDEF